MLMNLGGHKVNAKCPNCGFTIKIILDEAKKGITKVCPGCKKNVKLVDKNNSIKQAEKSLDTLMNDIKKMFK